MSRNIVVIGAGQAAIAFAARLRKLDETCNITLIGEEPALPYQRPPLSKKYMTGQLTMERLLLRPAQWYDDHKVTCRCSVRVTAISLNDKTVTLNNGETLSFDKLLFATGSTPRKLPDTIGGNLESVHVLRNLADSDAIAAKLQPDKKVLIIGGGYIGLEAAAIAREKGLEVTVCEMADRILKRVAAKPTSDYFRALHSRHGVRILENMTLTTLIENDGRVCGAEFSDGTQLDTNLVLVGIGIIPNDRLAAEAGLDTDNGIAVDNYTRTSHPDVHAAGDCASFTFRGHRTRLESVQNAIDQAEIAACNIAGQNCIYQPVPWFWSDQYDCKLQIAGLNTGYDRTVVRDGRRENSQSVWYFRGNEFLAVDAMNDPKAYMFGKRILEFDRNILPEQAGDPEFDLKSLIE
jgi:3-phenylpropionate/trans-cinnamate dioxygenase ferredoxin reductase component